MNAQILVHCVCQFQLTSISVSDTAPLLLAMPTILSGWVRVYDYNNHDLTYKPLGCCGSPLAMLKRPGRLLLYPRDTYVFVLDDSMTRTVPTRSSEQMLSMFIQS